MEKIIAFTVGTELEIVRTGEVYPVTSVHNLTHVEPSYLLNGTHYWHHEVRDPKALPIPFVPKPEEPPTEAEKAWQALVKRINHNFPIRQKLAAILGVKITYNYDDTIEEQLNLIGTKFPDRVAEAEDIALTRIK